MLEIMGKHYYIDVDNAIEQCRPVYPPKKGRPKKIEESETSLELNVFKFEILKSCVERILLYEYTDDKDDDSLIFQEKSFSLSFAVAFNTLLKYEILIEELNG
jgi:hypothetical protein